MKHFSHLCILCTLLLGASINTFAQGGRKPYSSAIGGRIEINKSETYFGPTYKHYLDFNKSYELMALTDFDHGVEFYGLMQYNGTIPDLPQKLRWVLGGGVNLGSWTGDSFVLGLTGMMGIEYSFDEIPLNLGLDWKPVFNLVTENHDRFWPSKIGISVRYTVK